MIRRPPRSTRVRSSAASDVYKRQGQTSTTYDEGEAKSRDAAAARGAAVHTLLEWSQANEWREPAGEEGLLAPVRAWLGSDFLRERVRAPGTVSRTEVPLILGIEGEPRAVLRGSIDLLVEREGEPPLVIDYKTDRLNGAAPAERAVKYGVQRSIYALAVAEARAAAAVEVAYVFLCLLYT